MVSSQELIISTEDLFHLTNFPPRFDPLFSHICRSAPLLILKPILLRYHKHHITICSVCHSKNVDFIGACLAPDDIVPAMLAGQAACSLRNTQGNYFFPTEPIRDTIPSEKFLARTYISIPWFLDFPFPGSRGMLIHYYSHISLMTVQVYSS